MLKKISLFALIAVVLAACSGNENSRPIKESVSAFIKGNDQVVAFGKTGLKKILNKSHYDQHAMLKGLISSEEDGLSKFINLEDPVYYAAEGPLKQGGSPEKLFLFMEVTDKEALEHDLTSKKGFIVEEADGLKYTEDGDFVLGFKGNLAIAIIQGGDYEAKEVAQAAFERAAGEVSGGQIDQLLEEQGDLVLTMNLERLYGSSNTDLAKLDEATQKELEEMVKGSFVQTVCKFEDGGMVIETKNMFSQKLKDVMFFREDPKASIVDRINQGEGDFLAGFSANIDMRKMEDFYAKYSPETMDVLLSGLNLNSGVLSLISGSHILSTLIDGRVGASIIANVEMNDFGYNVHISGDGTSATTRMAFMGLKELPQVADVDIRFDKDGISASGNPMAMMMSEMGMMMPMPEKEATEARADLPKGMENFGKKGINFFLDFRSIDVSEFGFAGGDLKELAFFEIVDYITFEYSNDGGRLYVKAVEGQENVLKQATDVAVEVFSEQLNVSSTPMN